MRSDPDDKKKSPIALDETHAFSSKAIRSLMSRIGDGLMSVAGYELVDVEEENEADTDPQDRATRQHMETREAQLAAWRAEAQQAAEVRKTLQGRFLEQREKIIGQTRDLAAKLREQLEQSASDIAPIDDVSTVAPIEIGAPEPEPPPVEEEPDYGTDLVDQEQYNLPGTTLFDDAKDEQILFIDPDELERQKRIVQDTLDDFAIDAIVWDAIVGPRVTQLRIKPGYGVRVDSIKSLTNDLARALSAESIRIQSPIPGKPYVGIEIANGNTAPLNMGITLRSKDWQNTDAAIPLLLGMELGGSLCIADLAAAPHLLIAGATGSGKSVCMNTIIISLISRFSPDELELILVDPKRVEFSAYESLPHLVRPVITEPTLVVPALQWVVREMEKRYKTMAPARVRNIAGYNEKMEEQGKKKMPYLVVIIDELADIMLTSGVDAELSLARIAQLSRAVGIHTVIATQRPSVNVITGMIKANFPTRIAFKVASQIDSRTIIDGRGAEVLRGQGDMLFCPPGIGQQQRVQGAWVNDGEIARVVAHCTGQREQHFKTSVTDLAPCAADQHPALRAANDSDPLFDEAVDIILRDQRASTSYLQRCLRIGYNRAANLIEEMEANGILGPQIGSSPREIFIEHR
jgi:S-DNA-T family DNA segregation ATPase FtsK/SpoIIIE